MANPFPQGGMVAPGYGGGPGAQPNVDPSLPEPIAKEGTTAGDLGAQQQPQPAQPQQAGAFCINPPPVYNHPQSGNNYHTLESIVSIACLGAFLLLSLITVAILGAANTKYLGLFFTLVRSAAFLLAISVLIWPFAILVVVMDGISLAKGASVLQPNTLNMVLPVICCSHAALSYLLFGAECAVLNDLQMYYKEASAHEIIRDAARMYLGAGIVGLFSFVVFFVPLILRVVQTVRNAKLSR